jgi:hypothetical protein
MSSSDACICFVRPKVDLSPSPGLPGRAKSVVTEYFASKLSFARIFSDIKNFLTTFEFRFHFVRELSKYNNGASPGPERRDLLDMEELWLQEKSGSYSVPCKRCDKNS